MAAAAARSGGFRRSGLVGFAEEGPATAARRGPGVRRRYRPKKREVELPATYLLRLELEGGFGVLSTRANHGVKGFQKFQTFFSRGEPKIPIRTMINASPMRALVDAMQNSGARAHKHSVPHGMMSHNA